MRHLLVPALLAAVLAAPLTAADTPAPGVAPPPAPVAQDPKAQIRELEKKIRQLREQAIKADPELSKLQTEAEEAQKKFYAAVEDKLKDNADFQATKKQLDELRPKKDGRKDDAKKVDVHEQH